VSHFAEMHARWEDERRYWPAEWRDAARMSDGLVTATAAEVEELMGELESVLSRFRETLGTEPRPGARRVSIQLYSMPTDLDDRP
jgi:hypothetical protein